MVTKVQTENMSEIARARASIYRLLAAVYSGPPSRDFLQSLENWTRYLLEEDDTAGLLPEDLKRSLRSINSFFRQNTEEVLKTISVEYTRLFRGVKQAYSPPPPYESVYREGEGHVFGETTVAVHREYQRFGLELVTEMSGEPPDHISFELEFMHFLCHGESEAWEKGDEEESLRLMLAEREFLESHLMAWVPKFCTEVRKQESLGLFGGLADLTESWIGYDYYQHLKGGEE